MALITNHHYFEKKNLKKKNVQIFFLFLLIFAFKSSNVFGNGLYTLSFKKSHKKNQKDSNRMGVGPINSYK